MTLRKALKFTMSVVIIPVWRQRVDGGKTSAGLEEVPCAVQGCVRDFAAHQHLEQRN